jgi:hypothetical protein
MPSTCRAAIRDRDVPAHAFLDRALDFRGLVGRLVLSRHGLARCFLFHRLAILIRGARQLR